MVGMGVGDGGSVGAILSGVLMEEGMGVGIRDSGGVVECGRTTGTGDEMSTGEGAGEVRDSGSLTDSGSGDKRYSNV